MYQIEMEAQLHREELRRVAERERLARQVRGNQPNRVMQQVQQVLAFVQQLGSQPVDMRATGEMLQASLGNKRL